MSNRRQDRRENRDQETNTEHQEMTTKRKRRRWPWILLILLVLFYFLPAIIVRTPLKQKAIDWATADFKGNIVADNVSTGWFSPTRISGVTVRNDAGDTLVTVDSVTTSKSLYGFASASSELGEIEVENPKVYLHLRPDGSNLEDAIAEYMKPSDEPASDLPHLQLTVKGGEVHIATSTDTQTWLIDNLNVNSEIAGQGAAVVADVSCNAQATNQPAGVLQLRLALDAGSKQIIANNGTCQLQTQAVPVSVLVPALQRVIGPCNAIGQIDGNADFQFSDGGSGIAANLDRMTISQLALVAPHYLKNDQVTLERLFANGQLKLAASEIQAVNFETKTDFGSVTSNGQIDLAHLSVMAPTGEVPTGEFTAHGEVELPKIASMIPETLGLHKDLSVETGKLTFDVTTRAEAGMRRLVIDSEAFNLTARRGGQLLNWHKPLRLTAQVAQSNNDVVLENVRCESDFVTVTGKANSQIGNFLIENGDLALLQQNLSQFVDLTGVELAGKFGGEFSWSFKGDPQLATEFSVSDRPVQIGGKFEINQPIIQLPEMPRWSPDKLVAICNASGKSLSDGTIQINSGGARAVVGKETFTVRLAEPITDLANLETAKLNCDVKGSVDGWLSHIRNFVWCGDFDATGRIESTFEANVSPELIVLNNLEYQMGNLAFDGYGAQFNEQVVSGDGQLSYDLNSGLIYMPIFNVSCSSLNARAQEIRMTVTEVINVTGDVAFAADMNRITNWFGISPDQDSINWFGTAEGNAKLSSNNDAIIAQVNAVVNEFVAAQRQPAAANAGVRNASSQMQWSELLRDDKVEINGAIGIAQDFDTIHFSEAKINSSAVAVGANGSISDLAGSWQTQFQGQWSPDWNKIDGLLDAYTYETLKLSGSGPQQFDVNGPLFSELSPEMAAAWIPPELKVQTRFAWDAGEVLDLPLGASEIQLDVNQSVAFLQSSEISFVGGALNLKPIIDMRSEEPYLVMESEKIVDNIDLSSEVCKDFLKYLTPLVADATEAQGKITVNVDSLQAPIYEPMQLQTRGTISLKGGSVGAGPLAEQLFTSVQQIKQLLKPGSDTKEMQSVWMDLGDQEIPFVVQDGRVHHQGIRLNIDDVVVTTEGFVGLDQTVNLVASIPIQDEWLGDNRWLASLSGQSLQIPIGGTATKPRLDTQAIRQLSQQLVQQASRNAINGVIQEKTGEVQNRIQEEVQQAQQKLNNKIQNEIQDRVQDKIQNGIQEKLGGELQKGLKGLFGN